MARIVLSVAPIYLFILFIIEIVHEVQSTNSRNKAPTELRSNKKKPKLPSTGYIVEIKSIIV